MKYGIELNNKTKEPVDKNVIKEFKDDHWENLMKMANPCWIQFPKKKVFISFNDADRKRMKILRNRINESELLQSLVVEEKRVGNKLLAEMVIEGINESDFLVVILSDMSINEQWVNQEVGYARSKEDIEIIPVIQNSAISELKGFIHKQSHLPYTFDIKEIPRTDNSQFGKVCNQIKQYLESRIKQKHKFI